MKHPDRFACAAACLALLAPAALAQPAPARGRAHAELHIALPDGGAAGVAIEPGDRRVVIELPRGASLPIDFFETTGGLVRDGEVTSIDADRQRVELLLAAGYLQRFAVSEDELVLTFVSLVGMPQAAAAGEDVYHIGAEDKLAVTVHNRPELSATLTVTQAGHITVPLVGEVMAAGSSTSELADRIAELLGRSFLVDPQVDVSVAEYRSQWVMVAGEVIEPGRLALRGGTRLKEVISEAGGFRDTAGQEIVISRRLAGGEEYEAVRVDREKFESGMLNPVLRAGDIVDVPRAAYCYVQGEVRAPGRIPIERGTTLLRVLALVGGLTDWADRSAVRILYPDGREGEVNLKRIYASKAPDPPITGNEVIVVRRRFF